MKLSSTILLVALSAGTAGIFGSNYILKKEYERLDKSDPYWNYSKVQDKPFRHVVIKGGNISNIVFEESAVSYVKLLNEWRGSHDGSVQSRLASDTLYLDFSNTYVDMYEKYWLQSVVPVRLSSPALRSVNGINTKLVLDKFNQPTISIALRGDSRVQINSYRTSFDEINVNQQDSSLITFSVSKELFVPDSIHVKHVIASASGTSLLNLRTATIDSLDLRLTNAASIAISGYSLNKLHEVMPKRNQD